MKSLNLLNSIRFKVILIFVIIITPLLILLFYNNFYAMNIVREQVAQSYSNTLPLYVRQIDKRLDEIRNYLIKTATLDPDLTAFRLLQHDSIGYFQTLQILSTRLGNEISFYNEVDTFFIYSKNQDELIISTEGNYYSERYSSIRSILDQLITDSDKLQPKEWKLLKIKDQFILCKIETDHYGTYFGAFVNVSSLADIKSLLGTNDSNETIILSDSGKPLMKTSSSEGKIKEIQRVFTDLGKRYRVITDSNESSKYILVGSKSDRADLFFVTAIPEKDILRDLPFFQLIIYFIIIVAIITFIFYTFFIWKVLFKPFGELTRAMKKIAQGDINMRMEERGSNEFRFMVKTFNNMASQIHNLKINVYEEEIRTQQAELKHLQVQINPHFYANSLNIIYNLAALKDFKLVQKMTIHLAEYFRFIMRTNTRYVTLSEEINHIRNYLEIQRLRFVDKLEFHISVPQEYENCSLPPLTIQPFVENAIIHGLSSSKGIFDIEICVSPGRDDYDQNYEVRIIDNGCGFPNEVLTYLQEGQYITNNTDKHLGIWNVYNRLKMCFGNRAEIKFENKLEGGAEVSLKLPKTNIDKEEGKVC